MWPLTIILDSVNPNNRNQELKQKNSNSVVYNLCVVGYQCFPGDALFSLNLHNPPEICSIINR